MLAGGGAVANDGGTCCVVLLLLISGKWLRRRCVAIAGCDVVCILYFLVTISVSSALLRRSGLAAVGVEGGVVAVLSCPSLACCPAVL